MSAGWFLDGVGPREHPALEQCWIVSEYSDCEITRVMGVYGSATPSWTSKRRNPGSFTTPRWLPKHIILNDGNFCKPAAWDCQRDPYSRANRGRRLLGSLTRSTRQI